MREIISDVAQVKHHPSPYLHRKCAHPHQLDQRLDSPPQLRQPVRRPPVNLGNRRPNPATRDPVPANRAPNRNTQHRETNRLRPPTATTNPAISQPISDWCVRNGTR